MLRYAGGAASRRIHHQDAAARRGFQIDVIHAYARAAHDAQLWSLCQQFVGYARGAAHDQRVGIGKLGSKRGRAGLFDFPACVDQQLHSVRTDFIGDDNFHGTRAY